MQDNSKLKRISETSFPRTLGDGMEHIPNIELKWNSSLSKPTTIYNNSTKPIETSSSVIRLVPKYTAQNKNKSNIFLSKQKEPKFIPYEPYKAAVEPIEAAQIKTKNATVKKVTSKNNIEIQQLVQHMAEMRMKEMDKLKEIALSDDELIPKQQWQKEKDKFETDIKNLQETKGHLENQLKFQIQVNSELKTLLVAAVGEDLETRVQHLTEDKLSLARALLKSANCLTTHQEQTEWLSGQCEVWKSKFLASSLMVEELARWKSVLTNRVHELHEVTRKMLIDFAKVQKQLAITFDNLNKIHVEKGNESCKLTNGDVMELSNTNKRLSDKLRQNLVKGNGKNEVIPSVLSDTEKLAVKILKSPISLSSSDAVCGALVGTAHSLIQSNNSQANHGPRYLQHQPCSHCTSEVHHI